MLNTLPLIIISLIWCGSFLIAVSPFLLFHSPEIAFNYLYMLLIPILFSFSFVTIAGGISRLAQKGIIRGTFPRKPFDKIYFLRRIYGPCWTQVYYFKPLYAVFLSIPFLKKYLFRIFGYKHSTNFTVYPDTWIRDLTILNIGEGAYLSNRATIGTNICLSDGNILVDSVEIGENGLVGHLALLAPGTKVGKRVEVGVNTTVGIRTRFNEKSKVHPCCAINHGAIIGEASIIGTMSYIGLKAVIGANLDVPAGAYIPNGSIVNTQEEMDKLYNSETQNMREHALVLKEKLPKITDYDLKV